MTPNAIEIEGTLREDGTLVLDHKPDLPPGRVKVIVKAIPDYKQTNIWRFFEKLRAEQQAMGHVPRSKEEIDAFLADSRDEGERERIIERIQEECRRHRENQQPPEDR